MPRDRRPPRRKCQLPRRAVTARAPCVMNTPCRVTSAHAPSPAIVNRAANSTRFLLACVVARTAMASVVRTGVVRAAQGACVGARTTRVAATAGQRRVYELLAVRRLDEIVDHILGEKEWYRMCLVCEEVSCWGLWRGQAAPLRRRVGR